MNKYSATHKTIVTLEIEHTGPLPDLAEMIANRVHTMDKVSRSSVMTSTQEPITLASFAKRMRNFLGMKNA